MTAGHECEPTDAEIDERIRRYHDVACGYQRRAEAAERGLGVARSEVARLREALLWALDALGEYVESEHEGDHTCGNPYGACDMTCAELADYARRYAEARALVSAVGR